MIAVDTNILVYAHRREASFHAKAQGTVRELAEGDQTWSIPWPCVYEFISVVTNPRIWKEQVTSQEQASAQVKAWLNSPSLRLLAETSDFYEILEPLANRPKVRGAVIHDARIAALCLAHGVDELLTKDRDFQLFPELNTRDPLLSV